MKTETTITAAAIDEMARKIVGENVRYSVSSLIYGLSKSISKMPVSAMATIGLEYEDFTTLSYRQPDADDYHDAAQYGADYSVIVSEQSTDASGKWHWSATDADGETNEGRAATRLQAWQDAFEFVGADEPDGTECLEHWLVTDDLARRLLDEGEAVAYDVAGMTVWGRCTSGQAIYADGVLQRIARGVLEA